MPAWLMLLVPGLIIKALIPAFGRRSPLKISITSMYHSIAKEDNINHPDVFLLSRLISLQGNLKVILPPRVSHFFVRN